MKTTGARGTLKGARQRSLEEADVDGAMLGPVFVLVLVVASDAWVAWDATRRRARGADVVVSIGPVTLARPEHWLLACVFLWVIAFPLYLVARRES